MFQALFASDLTAIKIIPMLDDDVFEGKFKMM